MNDVNDILEDKEYVKAHAAHTQAYGFCSS